MSSVKDFIAQKRRESLAKMTEVFVIPGFGDALSGKYGVPSEQFATAMIENAGEDGEGSMSVDMMIDALADACRAIIAHGPEGDEVVARGYDEQLAEFLDLSVTEPSEIVRAVFSDEDGRLNAMGLVKHAGEVIELVTRASGEAEENLDES